MPILFSYIAVVKETKMAIYNPKLVAPIWNKRRKSFWGITKKCENENLSFFILNNHFRILGTGRFNKVFYPRVFIIADF